MRSALLAREPVDFGVGLALPHVVARQDQVKVLEHGGPQEVVEHKEAGALGGRGADGELGAGAALQGARFLDEAENTGADLGGWVCVWVGGWMSD